MQQGTCAAALAALVMGITAMGMTATAAAGAAAGDACVALEQAVYRAVLQSGEGRPLVRLDRATGNVQLHECGETARAASAGFARAMARQNVYLTWQWERDRGDICLSGDLSQCYPNGNPFVPFTRTDAAFVADSWVAVVRAVGQSMPRGYVTDVTRFSGAGLSQALTAELEASTGGRLRQSYDVR